MRRIIQILVVVMLVVSALPAAAQEGEPCIVSTNRNRTVRLREGPGTNKTAVGFLPAGTDFQVIARFLAPRNQLWFQLVREQAAPESTAAEVWVGAVAVTARGNCDAVPLVNPAPAAPPANPADPAAPPAPAGALMPRVGRWSITADATTQFGCVGTEMIPIPTRDLFETLTGRTRVTSLENGFAIDGYSFAPFENGQWVGVLEVLGEDSVQFIVTVESDTRMSGVIIITLTIEGTACSARIPAVMERTGR